MYKQAPKYMMPFGAQIYDALRRPKYLVRRPNIEYPSAQKYLEAQKYPGAQKYLGAQIYLGAQKYPSAQKYIEAKRAQKIKNLY